MKKILPFLATLTLAYGAVATPLWANPADADNTGKNARDADGAAVTPFDQSEKESDLTMTQHIRQAVVADDTLSTNAKNIKIITINGMVTLRGPVDSEDERQRVLAKAQQLAGPKNVDNQLELNEQ
ncbi:MAG: BON domain-containing protein [Candidatus Binatia bacterium]